jgi:D-serine deaminase-like pyridoxal phosphate-dependent protein
LFYTLNDIKTPALILDEEVLLRNLDRTATYALRHWLKLRPHLKTHKSLFVAEQQKKRGALDVAVGTLAEARIFAELHFRSIFITRPVSEKNKWQELAALNHKTRVIVAADNADQVKKLGKFFKDNGSHLSVRLEIDSGQGRCGVLPENGLAAALTIAQTPGVVFDGIFTHPGHVYAAKASEVNRIARQEADALIRVYRDLQENDIPCHVRSAGSTPTHMLMHLYPDINEIRPGNYVYNDRMQVSLKAAEKKTQALRVMASVISIPARERIVINAGSKALGLDLGVHGLQSLQGFGEIDRAKGVIASLSEEHGIVRVTDSRKFKIGQNLMIYPNHACNVVNLFNFMWLKKGKYITRQLTINARGMSW